MSEISRTALFGKLNPLGYKAIEGATVFCKMRGNPYVELEHWMAQLLQNQESDLQRIVAHYGLDISLLAKDVTAALDRLPRGATAISDIAEQIPDAIERAWTYATLKFGENQVRTGYLLVGMLKTPNLRNRLLAISRQFEKVKVEDLTDHFAQICDSSAEARMGAQDGSGVGSGAPGEDSGAMAPAAMGKGEALKKFAVDLTEKARKGEMDPVTGRDEEIRQIVDILMRRRQNNPLLTGEAGVGKTAVVEGFAQRLARGDVPPQLKDVSLLALDIGLLQAGASMKGEFEQRLRQVIDEVQSSERPIVLFIDEIHTLIGAGGAAGTGARQRLHAMRLPGCVARMLACPSVIDHSGRPLHVAHVGIDASHVEQQAHTGQHARGDQQPSRKTQGRHQHQWTDQAGQWRQQGEGHEGPPARIVQLVPGCTAFFVRHHAGTIEHRSNHHQLLLPIDGHALTACA